MIVMIDMGLGNLDSVRRAFRRVGVEVLVTGKPDPIRNAEALILPGVGTFGDGMAGLHQRGLIDPILGHAVKKKPVLGICLGMQMLAESSDEYGLHEGLGLVPGQVTRLQANGSECRVPNMGWCDVTFRSNRPPFNMFESEETFYFAHSYHFSCADSADIAATFEFSDQKITAAIQRDNLFGMQFHPEKSQDAGLHIVESFVRQVAGELLVPLCGLSA